MHVDCQWQDNINKMIKVAHMEEETWIVRISWTSIQSRLFYCPNMKSWANSFADDQVPLIIK